MGKYDTLVLNGKTYVLVPLEDFEGTGASGVAADRQHPARETFGETLRRVRERHGLTEEQLAEAIGTTQAQVSRLENGQKAQPRTEKRLRAEIEKHFGSF